MKGLLLAVFVGALLLNGCATKQPEQIKLTPEQTVLTVQESMKKMGITTEVSLKDVDQNGSEDIYVVYVPDNEPMTLLRRSRIFGSLTGVMKGVQPMLDWPANTVFFKFTDGLFKSTVSNCASCVEKGMSDTEVSNCVGRVWVKVK